MNQENKLLKVRRLVPPYSVAEQLAVDLIAPIDEFKYPTELELNAAIELLRLQAECRFRIETFAGLEQQLHIANARIRALQGLAVQVEDSEELLQNLCKALNNAFISTWQSTQAWQKELDAANEYLNSK